VDLVLGGARTVSLASSGSSPAMAPSHVLNLDLSIFASGFSQPVSITHAGPGDDRLYVIEQAGVIKIVSAEGTVLPVPFLDISDRVDSSATEEGLLGLAFHPEYATNGYFYVNYTNTTAEIRRTRISRFSVTGDPNVADPDSEDILLTVEQPYPNHNAGDIQFGPDGYLYIPLGDGGGAGDPDDNAQNLALLLGKISRIDVDASPGSPPDCPGTGSGHYTVPDGNPLADGAGGVCDEIWAIGLRNPWRSSFDRLTGDLYIGDVGQNDWEEIDVQPANSTGSGNYGWRCYEGNHPYNTTGCGPIDDYTFPVFEYGHVDGCSSVIGGYVYRGSRYPAMYGRYLLADYCSGSFWDLAFVDGDWQATQHNNLAAFGYVAFGEDAQGELYVVNRATGTIYALEENGPKTWVYLPLVIRDGD
jgi:glucose/arabinose dehydrogenase